MDLTAMSNAERWQEISEVMSFNVQPVEVEAAGDTEIKTEEDVTAIEAAKVDPAVTIEAETIHEPRTPRVVSITELRQRLGIEETPLARSAPLPMTGRPRIVRRRETEAYPELAAG
jgi:hypothetical protein